MKFARAEPKLLPKKFSEKPGFVLPSQRKKKTKKRTCLQNKLQGYTKNQQ
jgi:hypothetical protein